MLDVDRLVLLREVKLRGSISGAARALAYTQSAVSQQLSLLEKEAGVTLLEKVGRTVRLTPVAEVLVKHVEGILAILEHAETDLATSEAAIRRPLRVAAFRTISRNSVPGVIADLAKRHPEIDIRFQQATPEDGLVLLTSRRIDVLITDGYPGISRATPDDLHADLLIEDPIRAYLPPGAGDVTLDVLRRVRWVFEPEGTEAHEWSRWLCRHLGFEPDVAYECEDLLFQLRMVEAGLAGAFLPDTLVRAEGADLEAATLPGALQRRHISLICRAGAERRPSIIAFRDAFADRLQEPPGRPADL
jgi:DNA-binding transcriptional LysR family regulator